MNSPSGFGPRSPTRATLTAGGGGCRGRGEAQTTPNASQGSTWQSWRVLQRCLSGASQGRAGCMGCFGADRT